jgi:hypothetical protein
MDHAVAHERRQSFLIEVLELAASAFREMTARRLRMMRAWHNGPVIAQQVARRGKRRMPASRGYAVAFRRDPDDLFALVHRAAA